jgi:hypothetical protein
MDTTVNTNDWAVYDNDISIDYKEFFKGSSFNESELPLYYSIQKKANLNKVRKALILESTGPELIRKSLKDILEVSVIGTQFFEVELYYCEDKIEGFYALNLLHKINCVDIENSEYRLTNFDTNRPSYLFYYMKLKDDIFNDNTDYDIVRCKEMPRNIVVSERLKDILIKADLKGLQFSDSVDMTPQRRTVYERI